MSLFISNAQDNNILKERLGFKVILVVDKEGTQYETDVKSSPYLNGPNILQLYPSENIFIEIEQVNGVISSMKTVKEIKNPSKTIQISFEQNLIKKIHGGMILKINNPFPLILNYSAKIFLLKENKWVSTDVMPVQPKLSSFETWPDVIVTIALSDWKLL
jgi:hypothetical protein